jgi:hypothetical protein
MNVQYVHCVHPEQTTCSEITQSERKNALFFFLGLSISSMLSAQKRSSQLGCRAETRTRDRLTAAILGTLLIFLASGTMVRSCNLLRQCTVQG